MRNIVDTNGSAGSSNIHHRMPDMLPVDNATVPYWRSQLHDIDSHRSTNDLPTECDIAIIGSGLAGVSVAWHLAKLYEKDNAPLPSIVMLEARQVCSGATGRNGGHAKMKTSTMQSLIPRFGLERATAVRKLFAEQNYALKEVVEQEELDCEFEMRRSYDVYLDEEEAKEAEEQFRAALKKGDRWTRDVDLIPRGMLEQVTSIKGAKAALSTPICSFWPYKLTSQLLARLLATTSLNLQTHTPVTALTSTSHGTLLTTPRGTLRTSKLILATNAYTAHLLPQYRNVIVPYRGSASHLVSSHPIFPHLNCTYNIAYARPWPAAETRVDYLNPRPNGSIVVGGGKWLFDSSKANWYNTVDDSIVLEATRPHFGTLMQRYFHGWADSEAEVESLWSGIMGATADGMPHVGRVPGEEGMWVLAGFNGGGNSMLWLVGKGVAEMVKGGGGFAETGLPAVFESTRERMRDGRV